MLAFTRPFSRPSVISVERKGGAADIAGRGQATVVLSTDRSLPV
jgi:hypothetical protein